MYIFFVILFLIKVVKADSDEGKYIDLLPEKEKEEFLETIARRILADDVQTKDDRPRHSGEISEDQLNAHDEYVQRILREESQNLRKNENRKKMQSPAQDFSVISLEKLPDDNNGDRHIDLTLRTEQKVKKRTRKALDDDKELNNKDKDHRNPTQNDVKESDVDAKVEEESDVEDIQVKNFRRTTERKDDIASSHKDEYIVKQNTDFEAEKVDNSKDLEVNTQSDLDENADLPTHEENIDDHQSNDENLGLTQKIYAPLDNGTHYDTEKESAEKSETLAIHEITEYAPTVTSEATSAGPSKDIAITTDSILTSKSNITAVNMSSNGHILKPQGKFLEYIEEKGHVLETDSYSENFNSKKGKIKNPDVTPEDINGLSKNLGKEAEAKGIVYYEMPTSTTGDSHNNTDMTTAKIDLLTTASSNSHMNGANTFEKNVKIDSEIKTSLQKNNVNENGLEYSVENKQKRDLGLTNTKNSYKLANDMIHVLRSSLLDEPVEESKENERNEIDQKSFSKVNKKPGYEVYEIQPNSPPFFKKSKLRTEEQPYYVPIYNYAPNNAYYNPHNRLGPNNYDGDKDKFETEKTERGFELDYFYGDNQRKFRFDVAKAPEHKKKKSYKLNLPAVVQRPMYTEIFINPNDYLDIDVEKTKRKNSLSKRINNQVDSNESHDTDYSGYDNYKSRESFGHDSQESHDTHFSGHDNNHNSHESRDTHFHGHDSHKNHDSHDTHVPGHDNIKTHESHDTSDHDTHVAGPDNQNNHESHDIHFSGDDSDESLETHYNLPNNHNVKDDLKANIKKIRSFLYKNKLFGYVPAIKERQNKLETKDSENVDHKDGAKYFRSKKSKDEDMNPSTDYDFIKKILSISDEKDLRKINLGQKLTNLNIKQGESSQAGTYSEVDVFVDVIKDMVKENNSALVKFDWLGTTVELQSAYKKMKDMTEAVLDDYDIHPSDDQLHKYLIYLHKAAKKELIKQKNVLREDKKMRLPKNKKRKKGVPITDKGLIYRAWLVRKLGTKHNNNDDDVNNDDKDLQDFNEFLNNMASSLCDLHNTLKHIAIITKFNNQRWFENLRQLNSNFNRKQLLQLLLHIFSSRLLELVEESAKNGLEDGFKDYMKKNKKEVRRTYEEFVFVLKLLEEMKIVK